VGVYALFFVASAADVADGNYFNVPLAVEQALLVGMFLTRRRSVATSTRPLDWLFACGAWLPLLLRSADPGGIQGFAGTAIQTIGLVMTCACFVALGRSFGLVAANRGLKTMGPYRLVRHPIYLSHLITQVGFCIANPTAINVGIVVVTSACQVMRIRAEERVLTETGDYATYRNQVRWRLLPGIF
jgi:protein-S-isoprenylcysteine O-methyltransferase Ste14